MEGKPGNEQSGLGCLFKEYDRINELWIHENNQAEHRVNFFLTFFSAAIALIVSLATVPAEPLAIDDIALSIFIVSIVLCIFGITTLNRLFMRDLQIELFRDILEIIEKKLNDTGKFTDYFKQRREKIKCKGKNEKNSPELKQKKQSYPLRKHYERLRGTLSDLIMICLSLIIGSFFGSIIIILITDSVLAAIIAAFVFAMLSFFLLIFHYNKWIKTILRPFNYFPMHENSSQ